MNKQTLTILFLLLSYYSQAQIKFESGYFITNAGEKVECLIKNMDWKNNPTQIEYKTSEDAESKSETIRTIKEFGIIGKSKYQKHQVNIDKSKEEIDNLSTDRNPEFQLETLFLKVLVEGKANLYLYENQTLRKFFFKTEDKPIEQLIYKRYKVSQSEIGKNTRYKQQLWNTLKCDKISLKKVEALRYYKNQMINLFVDYNTCSNPDVEAVLYEKNQNEGSFNLTIRPRMNLASLKLEERDETLRVYDFGSKQNFSLGIEAEYILPFNKGKWGLFIEPTYQYFQSDAEVVIQDQSFSGNSRLLNASIDYKSIELPIGLRHYIFINNFSSLFITGAYVIDIDVNSKLDRKETITNNLTGRTSVTENSLELSSKGNFGLGIGFNYKSKYSVEFRYNTNRDLLSSFVNREAKYPITSIIVGYSIF
ncbi:tRNA modification GTPase [Aquimarina mytili]|uniref:tRNA modification GTPase n=1 Tax=Aquimarina mytili TaxID=874423 RepID=A0A936ZXA9_9FLAO|nr:tRNA modification GTPase [Aquimarina mytili]MBL0682786.1 tRNA modification GTPase [Aquimarina mytili]